MRYQHKTGPARRVVGWRWLRRSIEGSVYAVRLECGHVIARHTSPSRIRGKTALCERCK